MIDSTVQGIRPGPEAYTPKLREKACFFFYVKPYKQT